MSNEYDSLINKAQEIVLTALTEGREMTEDEKNRSRNMIEEAKGLKSFHNSIDELENAIQASKGKKSADKRDLGSKLADNCQFKKWFDSVAPGGLVSDKAKIPDSPTFTLNTPMFAKSLITGLSDTSGGAFIQNEYSGIYQGLNYTPPTLRDLVQVRQTETDAIDYVIQTTKITQAAPVAEATSAALPTVTTVAGEESGYVSTVVPNPGGGYKPEGSLAYQKKTANVDVIAVWLPATKRSIADSSQLRSIINQDLKAALFENLDYEILNGDGTPGFTGITNTTGILTQSYSTDLLKTIRKAITQLSKNGEEATGIVMNPDDWETAELALAAAAPYLPYTKSLWRIPVVEFRGTMPKNTAFVGNWKKAVLWDRETITISISDSHADYFTRNLVAILAELRAAFAVVKPTAFVKVSKSGA